MPDLTINLAELAEPFAIGDIGWRIGQSGLAQATGQPWARAFCYCTARAIQQRLDDVVGPGCWRNEYREWMGGRGVICGLSLLLEGEWVTKWDGAEQGSAGRSRDDDDARPDMSVKAALSTAMKRAAVQWGIGRYLYDVPEQLVQIVEARTQGANFARGKTKGPDPQRFTFWWLPPKLPTWALPRAGADETPTTEQEAELAQLLAESCWSEEERARMRGWMQASAVSTDRFAARLERIRQERARRQEAA